MSDELKRKAKQLNKVDGGDCLRLGQGIRKSLSKIKEQILKSAFFYSIQKIWKMLLRRPKFRIILTKSTFLSFLRRTFRIFRNKGLNNSVFGYVFIITIALIPLLLYGAKYVIDHRTLLERWSAGIEHVKDATTTGKRLVKQCAPKAALEVARKWNPALTYSRQRESMLRIADEIYNESPTYVDSTLVRAAHGIDVSLEKTSKGKTYEPIKITKTPDTRLSPSKRQIERKKYSTYMKRYYYSRSSYSTNTAPPALSHFYVMYNSLMKEKAYLLPPDEDLYTDYAYYCGDSSSPTGIWYHYVTWPSSVGMSSKDGSSDVVKIYYTKRKNLDDDTVKIECENDRLKVTTDDDVAYAVPAQCNVDIILTVPTNSAASNQNNYDKNTETSGAPYISTSTTPTTDAKSTPIWQITKEYQTFLKNFFYTRGVNVGVIPYSGNVSIYNDNDRSSWVKDPDNFVSKDFLNGTRPIIMGSMLYGTTGTAGTGLTSKGEYAGKEEQAYGLLCRGTTASYYGNTITMGDLLSTAKPSSYKFRRMVYNPCYAGNANLLSMKCEKKVNPYWMNPYFILEMNPDVKFIYRMLGAFYPYYDDRNVSNFIFIPVTWANNLFQSWSATGANSATNTSADSENLGRLSTPSKTTSGRKKAVILVVNKPDWFEPGELTYLGFDNDYSEIPMIEGDCIRGDINYSDTSLKFADGTAYNGTVQGAKKILKLTGFSRNSDAGYYECKSGTATLTFPQKYLVKLVVDRKVNWKYYSQALNPSGYTSYTSYWGSYDGRGIAYGNGVFVIVNSNFPYPFAYSSDGINWSRSSSNLPGNIRQLTYTGSYFVGTTSGQVTYSTTGTGGWYTTTSSGYYTGVMDDDIAWDGSRLFSLTDSSGVYATTDPSGSTGWSNIGTSSRIRDNESFQYGGGYYVHHYGSSLKYSTSLVTSSFTSVSLPLSGNRAVYGPGYWAMINSYGAVMRSSGARPSSWSIIDGSSSSSTLYSLSGKSNWAGFVYGNDKWIAFTRDGNIAVSDESTGTIKFTNISNGIVNKNTTYNVKEKKEFFIEPSQISNTKDSNGNYTITFNATNLRLISAEITNRPYVQVTPTVERNGDVFTLNAKVPFVISVGTNDTFTYTDNGGTEITKSISDGWGYMQVTPETHRYVKGFKNDGTPYYTVKVKFSSSISSVNIGVAKEREESVSNLNLGYNTGGTDTVSMGNLKYQKSNKAAKTDNATVSDGKIYCPIGTVLHVKAEPTGTKTLSGFVSFYGDNGVVDNIGTYTITGSKTFTFKGGQEPSEQYQYNEVNSTLGQNFGHNLSLYKVRYTCGNCYISAATLTNQWIRDYEGQYGRGQSEYKRLILSDGTLATKNSNNYHYSVYSTYGSEGSYTSGTTFDNFIKTYLPKFRDPCYSVWNIRKIQNAANSGTEYQNEGGNNGKYDYCCIPYGVKGQFCTFCTVGGGARTYIYINGDTTDRGGESEKNKWYSKTIYLPNANSTIKFMRLGYLLQHYIRNGYIKDLKSQTLYYSLSYVPDNGLTENKGIYLVKLGSSINNKIVAGDYICFNGDGELSVTVTPSTVPYGTIKFNCENESGMTHELFKENNFCIEPSQMTDNGDGTQYVSYTASNCTVTATYEYTNRMSIALKKSNSIPIVKWEVYGHKKEFEWKQASGSITTTTHVGSAQKLKFDGKRCYFGSVDGDIMYSDDFGQNWSSLKNTKPLSSNAMFTIGPARLYYVNAGTGEVYRSEDEGETWYKVSQFDSDGSGSWWDAFTYSFDANNDKAMAVRDNGEIWKSSDSKSWKKQTSLSSTKDGYYFGHLYHNGKWIVRNRDNPVVFYQSTDGSSWTSISSNLKVGNETFLATGSNIVMAVVHNVNDKIYTSTGDLSSFVAHSVNWPYASNNYCGSICYANGNFIGCNRVSSINFVYGTYHDGVLWKDNTYKISRETDSTVGITYITKDPESSIGATNFVVTSIKGTYAEIVNDYGAAIEYKKIELPGWSQYIDYSTNLYTTYKAKGRSDDNFFNTNNNGWLYDDQKGFYVNSSTKGYHTQICFDIPGDHGSLTYSDDKFEMVHLNASGWKTYSNKMAAQYNTSGLSRTYTLFGDFVNGSDCNLNDYLGSPGTISLMLQTLTLPINAALWAGADGSTLHAYKWQSDANGNWNDNDATAAVKEVTKSACTKLKKDWGDNLRVYLIKYRKQDKYNHPVTKAATNFDYSYLDNCATYVFDVPSQEGLNSVLSAISQDIKEWAGYTEAKNVS